MTVSFVPKLDPPRMCRPKRQRYCRDMDLSDLPYRPTTSPLDRSSALESMTTLLEESNKHLVTLFVNQQQTDASSVKKISNPITGTIGSNPKGDTLLVYVVLSAGGCHKMPSSRNRLVCRSVDSWPVAAKPPGSGLVMQSCSARWRHYITSFLNSNHSGSNNDNRPIHSREQYMMYQNNRLWCLIYAIYLEFVLKIHRRWASLEPATSEKEAGLRMHGLRLPGNRSEKHLYLPE